MRFSAFASSSVFFFSLYVVEWKDVFSSGSRAHSFRLRSLRICLDLVLSNVSSAGQSLARGGGGINRPLVGCSLIRRAIGPCTRFSPRFPISPHMYGCKNSPRFSVPSPRRRRLPALALSHQRGQVLGWSKFLQRFLERLNMIPRGDRRAGSDRHIIKQ